MAQLLCLKLYRLRLFIQVNVLLFLLFYFFLLVDLSDIAILNIKVLIIAVSLV